MKPPVKFGLIAALLIIALYLTLFYTGNVLSAVWQFSRIIGLLIMLPFIALTLLAKRRENGGLIGFKDSLKAGLQATLVITIIVAAFNFFFFKLELQEVYMNYASAEITRTGLKGKEAEDALNGMKQFSDPLSQAKSTLFWTLLAGTVMSLACATFIVRKPNEA